MFINKYPAIVTVLVLQFYVMCMCVFIGRVNVGVFPYMLLN